MACDFFSCLVVYIVLVRFSKIIYFFKNIYLYFLFCFVLFVAHFKPKTIAFFFIASINFFLLFSMYRPNVCADQEMSMLGGRQPCVQAFTRMVKVWKQGCTSHRWCMGYERR